MSPTTTVPTGVASPLGGGRPGGGGDVLHIHSDRPAANSISVEPPTPRPFDDQPPARRKLSVLALRRTNAGEVEAPGDGTTTEVATDATLPDVSTTTGTEARGRAGLQDHLGAGREPPDHVDLDAKVGDDEDEEDGHATVGPRAHLTLMESDGGVRLAGGPPGLLPLDTDCIHMITTLPPPYHHYDS